ncbi:MAG: hypothetical protein ABSG59_03015 [Verrucomicrobiota bacterium]|jgi:hypothetical protein
MNSETDCQKTRLGAYVIAILGTFLVMALLVELMRHYTHGPSLRAADAARRMQILTDFQAANAPLLEKYDWQDQAKGFVHVPMDRAMELVLREWQDDPAAGRSNLMARAAKEFAPAPKPPEQKNEYE